MKSVNFYPNYYSIRLNSLSQLLIIRKGYRIFFFFQDVFQESDLTKYIQAQKSLYLRLIRDRRWRLSFK